MTILKSFLVEIHLAWFTEYLGGSYIGLMWFCAVLFTDLITIQADHISK